MKEKIENLLKESFNNIQKNVKVVTQKFSEIQKAIIRKNVGAISEENGKLINSDGEEFNPLTDSSQVTHNGDKKVNEVIDTITDKVGTLTDEVNSNTEIISSLTGSGDGSVTKIVTDAINTLDSEVASVNNPDIVVTVTGKDGKLSKVAVESHVPNNTAFNALKNKVEAFLDATEIQGDVIDTLSEIQNYIKGDLEGAAAMANSISKNATDIANEKERALSEESKLATSINNEITRATEREDEIASDLSDEVTRATTKEGELSNSIIEETNRAIGKENEIFNTLKQEINILSQTDTYLDTQKADKTGYFKDLKVGTADNLLTKNEEVDPEFVIRPIITDNENLKVGTARINSIKGNSVVYNQLLMPEGWFLNDGLPSLVNNSTLTNKVDGFEYVANSEITNSRIWIANRTFQTKMIIGHKYIVVANGLRSNLPNSVPLRFYSSGDSIIEMPHDNGKYKSFIFTNTLKNESQFALITDVGLTIPAGTYIKGRVDVVDLTKMFNNVNVPTTVEEFEALYGNMPNEYNAGTIIDNHTSAIKSVGVNAWDEEWEFGWIDNTGANRVNSAYIRSKNYIQVLKNSTYRIEILGNNNTDGLYYLYDENKNIIASGGYGVKGNNLEIEFATRNTSYIRFYINESRGTYMRNICIHLVHTGYLNGKYFPYESQTRQLPTVEGGLKSAGTAYDEIRYNKSKDKWEHVQRVGSVDFGTLSWSKIGTNIPDVYRFVSFDTRGKAVDGENNILCVKYIGATTINGDDKTMQVASGGIIHICDHDYSDADATAFKQAMQGVILNYELATPKVTELDVDISPDYKVWDYGTEEAISEQLSTPLKPIISREFISNSQIVNNHIDIEVERERAVNKDKELESLISFNQTDSNNKITAESNRAQLAETTIQNNLNAEITRATNSENAITTELNKVKNELTVTNEAVVEEFTFEPHNQDSGVAQINSIHGNSVVLNQLAKDPLFETENNTNWLYRGYSSYNVSNGTVEIVSNGNGECYIDQFFNFTKNHVYLFMSDVNGGGQQSGVRAYYEGASRVMANYVNKLNEWERIHVFVKTPVEETGGSRIRLYCTYSGNVTSYFRNPRLIDLTKMFGSGNEPTTVEEFESLYGNMPSDYNEGEIIDNKVSSIKSVGTNIWDGQLELGMYDERGKVETGNYNRCKNPIRVVGGAKYYFSSQMNGVNFQAYYYDANMNYVGDAYWTRNYEYTIPTNAYYMGFYCGSFKVFIPEDNDICINLSDESINGKYFPYEDFVRELPTIEGGLKSAGNVCDEIRYNVSTDKWEHIQRVGSVDLGTLVWYYGNPSGNVKKVFYSENVKTKLSITPAQSDALKPNILSVNYTSKVPYDTLVVETVNKAITAWANQAELYRIVVADTAYTDATTFKEAMNGVTLYYELAEPIVTELSDDYNLSYQISKCGTVEAISDGLSSPFKGKIEYSTTIANKINSNIRQIEYLDNKINEISDNGNQIKVTYSELVSLRDNSKLKPGCWYRITDYVTTTSQLNTKSAGHQFDVLVLATDVNVLSEEARAINHKFEADPNKPIRYGSEYVGAPEYNNLYLFEATGESVVAQSGITYWVLKCYYVSEGEVTEVPSGNACVTTSNPPVVGEPVYMGETLEEALEATFLNIGEPITENPDYFANCNLNAWKIWYCLDNDTSRFEWAGEPNLNITTSINKDLLESDGVTFKESFEPIHKITLDNDGSDGYPIEEKNYRIVQGGFLDDFYFVEDLSTVISEDIPVLKFIDYEEELEEDFTIDDFGAFVYVNRTIIDNVEYDLWKVWLHADEWIESNLLYTTKVVTEISTLDKTLKKCGIIYRMIDEYNNDCPYDFKNILFDNKYYTFTWIDDSGEYKDSSIIQYSKQPYHLITVGEGIRNNKMYPYYPSYNNDFTYPETLKQSLNGNKFISNWEYDGGYLNNQCDNTLELNCHNNTFYDGCAYNIFKSDCHNIVFSDMCKYNTVGYSCYNINLPANSSYNTFGNGCWNYGFSEIEEVCMCIFENGSRVYFVGPLDIDFFNIKVKSGVQGTLIIPEDLWGNITIGRNSEGKIKIYNEADLVQ